MSKKQDFLRSEQNRDKHPESKMTGSATQLEEQERRNSVQNVSPQDRQVPQSGKVANDRNKMGHTEPGPLNEGQRTPKSQHDRQTLNGTMNVVQARTGGKGGGRSTRGGNVGGSG